MAVSVSLVDGSLQFVGNQRQVQADVTFDDSYSAGGEAVTAEDFGFTVLDGLVATAASAADDTALVVGVEGNLLRLYTTSGNAGALEEVLDEADVDAYTARVVAIGR